MIEIDGVRLQFEHFRTESGDYLSDDYWTVIDETTSPDTISSKNNDRLAKLIHRLNLNVATASVYLGGTDVADAHASVVQQVNSLNAGRDVPALEQLLPDVTAGHPDYSARYFWTNGTRNYLESFAI